jgi:hypothetical protein
MPSGVWERHSELATLECTRTQCNSAGKVAKYSRFFCPLTLRVLQLMELGPSFDSVGFGELGSEPLVQQVLNFYFKLYSRK